MFCEKCGAEVLEGDKFCQKCGASIGGEQSVVTNKQEKVDYKSAFIDPEEQLVAKVGNGYFENLLYKETKKCNLLLTDKRLYLKGTFYNDTGKGLKKTSTEQILDIEDITGTGFVYKSFSWLMLGVDIIFIVLSIALSFLLFTNAMQYGYLFIFENLNPFFYLSLSTIVVELFLMRKILMSRTTHFYIDYAGGKIRIDAKLIGIEDMQDFHKQIRRVKNDIKGKTS